MIDVNNMSWYAGGLHFECLWCGRCCSGPAEGYIWVTSPEVKLIADFLQIEPEQLRQKYLKRIGLRTTIIEQAGTKDCIFLNTPLSLRGAKRRSNPPLADCHGLFQRPRNDIHASSIEYRVCMIYPVRPTQCRIWPFWSENLASTNTWNKAAQKCPGVNRGRHYSFEEIEKIRKKKIATEDTENTEIKN